MNRLGSYRLWSYRLWSYLFRVQFQVLLVALVTSGLVGCHSVSGPSANAVFNSPQVTVVHVQCLEEIPCPRSCFFSSERPVSNPTRRYHEAIAIRDLISIRIMDSDPLSPFATRGGEFGPTEVPESGYLKVPHIGYIKVHGLTLADLSDVVTTKAKSVSNTADATVIRPGRMFHEAGVIGEVNKPGNYKFDRAGFNALNLLAAAGGGIDHPDNYVYKLKRDGKSYCYDYCTISNSPFLVEDGDVISVEVDPGYSYYTMGQFNKPSRLQLRGPNTSLADAIMESSGFKDGFGGSRADPKGIFVFRDAAYCGEWGVDGKSCLPGTRFIAYVLDVKRAEFPMLAQKFRLRERDVIYASEAPMSHVNRTVREIGPIIGLGTSATILGAALD